MSFNGFYQSRHDAKETLDQVIRSAKKREHLIIVMAHNIKYSEESKPRRTCTLSG